MTAKKVKSSQKEEFEKKYKKDIDSYMKFHPNVSRRPFVASLKLLLKKEKGKMTYELARFLAGLAAMRTEIKLLGGYSEENKKKAVKKVAQWLVPPVSTLNITRKVKLMEKKKRIRKIIRQRKSLFLMYAHYYGER